MFNKVKYRLVILAWSLCASLLLSACDSVIYDQLEPCRVSVRFTYDFNMAFANRLALEAKQIDLYVFDEKGIYLSSFAGKNEPPSNDFMFGLPLKPGNYTFMALAGHDENYLPITLKPGVSTIEDVKVQIKNAANTTIEKELQPLLHGLVNNVQIKGDYEKVITVPLVKNTNKIRLVLKGRTTLAAADYRVELWAANGTTAFDNKVLSGDSVNYRPYFKNRLENGDLVFELNTLRIIEGQANRLSISSASATLINLDLNELLLETRMEGQAMSAQEYLDRQDEFSIVLIGLRPDAQNPFLGAGISVNGWIIRQQDIEDL